KKKRSALSSSKASRRSVTGQSKTRTAAPRPRSWRRCGCPSRRAPGSSTAGRWQAWKNSCLWRNRRRPFRRKRLWRIASASTPCCEKACSKSSAALASP
ncbi:unnamed protein product, partial [Effrenium voratum]